MYKATITIGGNTITKVCETAIDAANWLDSQNNNLESVSTIELIETGEEIVYTE